MKRVLAALWLLAGCDQQKPDQPLQVQDVTLEPPATLDEGFQYAMEPFDIGPGEEHQNCYFFEVPYDEPMCVSRVQVAQNMGTHHMNIFRPDQGTIHDLDGEPGTTVYGGNDRANPCWRSTNWADWPLVINSQQSDPDDPLFDWTLPEGVVLRFEPRERLMLQSHYVNATTQAGDRGLVLVNFERVSCDDTVELGTMFATNQSINICPNNPSPEFDSSCGNGFSEDVTIVAANSHYHSRGRHFTIELYDPVADLYGNPFYENVSWDEPLMARDLNVHVPAGQRIGWHCAYEYQPPQDPFNCSSLAEGCCYAFGPVVETSEHCNIFVYYYPKLADYSCN